MKLLADSVLVHLTGHSKQLLVKVLIWKAQVRNKTSAFYSHDSWYNYIHHWCSQYLLTHVWRCIQVQEVPLRRTHQSLCPDFSRHGCSLMAWQSTLKLRKWPVVFHDDRSTPGMGNDYPVAVALIFHTDRQIALIRLVAWFISQSWNKFLDEVTSDPALTANRNGGPRQHRLGMVKLRTTSIRKGIQ